MAEPLKNHFGERVPRTLAGQIVAVWPAFRADAFLAEVLAGYDSLELMDRGRQIARVLRSYLPDDFPSALEILLRSIGDGPAPAAGEGGMASFFYLPHTCFVGEFGLEHFEPSMEALYVLTQRFTGEFSIRPFLERYEAETLALLRVWAGDPNVHVRRLVSEGTRPRLPWAGRLRGFQVDPEPVLALLELLKDDPEEYVRRSVANNLNDIGKDHPDRLIEVSRAWMRDAGEEQRALLRHALRSLVKQGNPGALALLGFGTAPSVRIENVQIAPGIVPRGGKVTIGFDLRGVGRETQQILVDLRVHYVKANGSSAPKVFKLKSVELTEGKTSTFRKTLSLAEMTTRKHYPGRHRVEALLNGRVEPIGAFDVTLG